MLCDPCVVLNLSVSVYHAYLNHFNVLSLNYMVPFEVLTNFKFNLFFKSFITIDLHSNANVNFNPNATKLTLSPNMIMDLIGFFFMGRTFQKGK